MSWFKGRPSLGESQGAEASAVRALSAAPNTTTATITATTTATITATATATTTDRGNRAEDLARRHLEAQGLVFLAANYRLARGPSKPAGEVDLVMRDRDGTLVFVEVRSRRTTSHGGAAASVGAGKQRRIVRAAQHYLRSIASPPPCRFDVIAIDGDHLEWLQAAFDAS